MNKTYAIIALQAFWFSLSYLIFQEEPFWQITFYRVTAVSVPIFLILFAFIIGNES